MKYFSSDWHLSHKATIEKLHRPFQSVEEMNTTIINNMLDIPKGSILYFLGDIGRKREGIEDFFNALKKRKDLQFHWILGNHDKKLYKQYVRYCNSISDIKEVKLESTGDKVILCHYPMISWNRSHWNSFHLYGHHHSNSDDRSLFTLPGKRVNVNCEFWNYKPLSEQQIVDFMKTKEANWDLIKKDTHIDS